MKRSKNAASAKGLKEYVFNKYLKDIKNKRIADLGCGNGWISKNLNNNNQIFSVDLKEYKDDIDYTLADLNKDFPFPQNTFDVILSTELIEHIENSRHFLRECKRCLKDSGRIIITTPNMTHFKARMKFLLKGALYGFDKREYDGSGHINPVFVTDFYRIAEEIGLKVLEVGKYKENTVVVMGKDSQKSHNR